MAVCCRKKRSKQCINKIILLSYVNDEGRPFGIGEQPQVSNRCKQRKSKAWVVNVAQKGFQ